MLHGLIEAGVMLLVCVAPWLFGATEPDLEFLLFGLLAVLLVLWAACMIVEWQFLWYHSPVLLCIAGLFLLATWQIVPLPRSVIRAVSPHTDQLYRALLPKEPEVLPFGLERPALYHPVGSTVSLYPAATRVELVRVLAVFLLFALVRNTVAGAPALRRLSIVVLINGTLLAYLGLAQFFSSPTNVVYWTFESPGHVFGPFINRNHFAFYINLCVGLGVGLLLYYYVRTNTPERSERRRRPSPPVQPAARFEWRTLPTYLLGNPTMLCISAALGLMIASSVICLSRGGFLALLGATFVVLSLRLWRSPRFIRLEAAVLAITIALGLLIWFGLGQVLARLGTIWSGTALEEGRMPLWIQIARAVLDFPTFGAGYGSFQYVEPLYRTTPSNVMFDHAHNEYLEALIEGGIPRFLLSVLAIVLLYRVGYRALSRYLGHATGALIQGMLLAISTAVIHSVGEFGIHVPAIVVLLTVVAAHLSAADSGQFARPTTGRPASRRDSAAALRLRGLVPPVAAVTVITLGLLLVSAGWSGAQVHLLRNKAFAIVAQGGQETKRSIEYLETASQLAPDFARLQIEVASEHLIAYEQSVDEIDKDENLSETSRAEAEAEVARKHMGPALQHYVQARDSCPLLGEAHVRLAAYVDFLERADPRTEYLDRAKRLVPADPELWYLAGLHEILGDELDKAWASWRKSLEFSPIKFDVILATAAQELQPEELIDKVLPDDPTLILRAALRLYPEKEEHAEERNRYFRRALELIDRAPKGTQGAEDLHVKAVIAQALGQREEALEAYRAALLMTPDELDWRCELAELLFAMDRLDECHRELVTVLRQRPDYSRAMRLYSVVSRIRAERM